MLTNLFKRTPPVSKTKSLFDEAKGILLSYEPRCGSLSDNLRNEDIFKEVFPKVSSLLREIPAIHDGGRTSRPDLFLLGAEFDSVEKAIEQYTGGMCQENPWNLIIPSFYSFELGTHSVSFEQWIYGSEGMLTSCESVYTHPFNDFTENELIKRRNVPLISPSCSKDFYDALTESVNCCPSYDTLHNLHAGIPSEIYSNLSKKRPIVDKDSFISFIKGLKDFKTAHIESFMGDVAKPLNVFHKSVKEGKYK